MSVTLASLVAVAALLVHVKRQRAQLAALQRERSASLSDLGVFSSDPSFASQIGPKLATLHTFAAGGGGAEGLRRKAPGGHLVALSIGNPAEDEQGGYIQVRCCDWSEGLWWWGGQNGRPEDSCWWGGLTGRQVGAQEPATRQMRRQGWAAAQRPSGFPDSSSQLV